MVASPLDPPAEATLQRNRPTPHWSAHAQLQIVLKRSLFSKPKCFTVTDH
jgi:hypothetical protein